MSSPSDKPASPASEAPPSSAASCTELVVASTNRGKLAELRALFADMGLGVRGIADVLARPFHVVEDGDTFAANAIKKARAGAAATHHVTLADDSGLEVDALLGKPGVRSARFAGEHATDAENNAALLRALEAATPDATSADGSPDGFRARFRCVLALVDPFSDDAEPRLVSGACEGRITLTPRGSGGFGYDPLFVVDGFERTLAELTDDEKNAVSHRARAMQNLRPVLAELLARREETTRRVLA